MFIRQHFATEMYVIALDHRLGNSWPAGFSGRKIRATGAAITWHVPV